MCVRVVAFKYSIHYGHKIFRHLLAHYMCTSVHQVFRVLHLFVAQQSSYICVLATLSPMPSHHVNNRQKTKSHIFSMYNICTPSSQRLSAHVDQKCELEINCHCFAAPSTLLTPNRTVLSASQPMGDNRTSKHFPTNQ